MQRRLLLALALACAACAPSLAHQPGSSHAPEVSEGQEKPGDYGYRHRDYHDRGLVEELERKVGHSCCDKVGECRATYVDLANNTALVDGRWCPLGHRTAIRKDITLPDSFALVCAGKSRSGGGNPCPPVYCVAISPGI